MPTTFRACLLAFAAAAVASAPAAAQDQLEIVASFSILGDMTSRVGGDHVAVTTLVGRNGDAHVYQPTPTDATALAAADLLIVNGLGFEGWMDRLVDSVGYAGPVAVAAEGVDPIAGFEEEEEGEGHDHAAAEAAEEEGEHEEHAEAEAEEHHHGGVDPHAWHDLKNAQLYVDNIAAALAAADPAHAADYAANADAYKAEIAALDAETRARIEAIPESRRRALTSHDAFGYFARAYGVTFIAPVGVSTDSEASAADVAAIIDQIRSDRVTAIFVENVSDPRLAEQIARETGVAVGGELYSDALSDKGTPGATFLGMARHNADTIAGALGSGA